MRRLLVASVFPVAALLVTMAEVPPPHGAVARAETSAAVPRLWLELDPGRFAAQPTVTRILWLRELDEALPWARGDGQARRAAQFAEAPSSTSSSGAPRSWRREIRPSAPRPEAFLPPGLRDVADLGGPARLFWRAADSQQPQGLVAIVGDLEHIWGGGMQAAIADYGKAFAMLGRFHHGVAEVREGQGRLTGRVLLIAATESDAKQASGALALASAFGRMVAATAVQTGGMKPEEAAALDAVLQSIETRVDGTRLTVHLGIDVETLQAILR